MHRLGRGDGGAGVAHGGQGDKAALEHQRGLDAKEGRFPHHQVRPFAHFDAAHFVADAVRNRGVDGVFGDVALGPEVVVAAVFFGGLAAARIGAEPAALGFHFVGGLPGADDDFAHAAHRLAVAAHHGDGAHVVQHVFGGNGFFADAAFGKGQVFGNARVQMVADHQHVHMFVQRVDGVGHGGVGGAG